MHPTIDQLSVSELSSDEHDLSDHAGWSAFAAYLKTQYQSAVDLDLRYCMYRISIKTACKVWGSTIIIIYWRNLKRLLPWGFIQKMIVFLERFDLVLLLAYNVHNRLLFQSLFLDKRFAINPMVLDRQTKVD